MKLTFTDCSEARKAIVCGADAQPLETILTGLTTAGVSDALARQICGLDTDAPAADALRRCREAISAKRTRDAAEGSGNGETPAAKDARPNGTHLRHSHGADAHGGTFLLRFSECCSCDAAAGGAGQSGGCWRQQPHGGRTRGRARMRPVRRHGGAGERDGC